jgi:hypothetical protein
MEGNDQESHPTPLPPLARCSHREEFGGTYAAINGVEHTCNGTAARSMITPSPT